MAGWEVTKSYIENKPLQYIIAYTKLKFIDQLNVIQFSPISINIIKFCSVSPSLKQQTRSYIIPYPFLVDVFKAVFISFFWDGDLNHSFGFRLTVFCIRYMHVYVVTFMI